MRILATWSGAIAGLLLIVVGNLVPAAIPIHQADGWSIRPLGITLQVPALLLTAVVCGPRSAMLAAVAYLSIGLFQIPVFHDGGGLTYLLDPGFGYLAGFIPAGWVAGRLTRQQGMEDPLTLAGAAAIGLVVLHLCGLANLLLGSLANRWGGNLLSLVLSYSLAILPQAILCCAIGVLAWALRRILLVPQ